MNAHHNRVWVVPHVLTESEDSIVFVHLVGEVFDAKYVSTLTKQAIKSSELLYVFYSHSAF